MLNITLICRFDHATILVLDTPACLFQSSGQPNYWNQMTSPDRSRSRSPKHAEIPYDNRSIIAGIKGDTASVCSNIETMDLEALVTFGDRHTLTRMGTRFTRTGKDKDWRSRANLWEWWADRPHEEVDVAALTEESLYYTWCVCFQNLLMQS